jgi:hypothetical protein
MLAFTSSEWRLFAVLKTCNGLRFEVPQRQNNEPTALCRSRTLGDRLPFGNPNPEQ